MTDRWWRTVVAVIGFVVIAAACTGTAPLESDSPNGGTNTTGDSEATPAVISTPVPNSMVSVEAERPASDPTPAPKPTPIGLPSSASEDREWAAHDMTLPERSRISVSFEPGEYVGKALVVGSAGSVPEGQEVIVFDQQLGPITRTRADRNGRFETVIDAMSGSHVFVGVGRGPRGSGVLIPTEPSPRVDGMTTIGAGRMEDGLDGAPWVLVTTLVPGKLKKGEPVPFEGKIVLPYAPWRAPSDGVVEMLGLMLTDSEGRQVGYGAELVSSFLTPTGLPIERSILTQVETRRVSEPLDITWDLVDGLWTANIAGHVMVPASWSDGLYRLTAEIYMDAEFHVGGEFAEVGLCCEAPIGNFEVGEVRPARLATTLFADVLDEGSRGGIRPVEQETWFDVSARIVARHDPVIPRTDSGGRPWSYNLEPYLPMFGAVDRHPSAIPPALLDFSTSRLTVTVQRTDGTIDQLGPAPLSHLAYRVPQPPGCYSGEEIASGGHPSGLIQGGSSEDAFSYRFPADGDYVIILNGTVSDFDGRVYDMSGEYLVTVGRQLKLGLGFLPGMPVGIGDELPLMVQVWPTIPAEIEFSVLHIQADGTTEFRSFEGMATNSGRWDGGGERLAFDEAGEFRIDVEARYRGPNGDLSVGRIRTGSVVASAEPEISAQGRRGIGTQRQWFFRPDFDPPIDLYGTDSGYNVVGDGLMWPPFSNGDIQWGVTEDRNDNAIAFRGAVQVLDTGSRLVRDAAVQARAFGVSLSDGLSVDDQILIGQMPLVTYADAESGTLGMQPDDIRLWAYFYGSAQRPDVRVRELIQGSEVKDTYWLFDDPYYLQSGVGAEGDLPTDYKFLYGGAVIHDRDKGEATYAAYGSLWVLTPDDDVLGARVLPPFRGAAGGPDGGPLFSTHGEEIDLFMVPLGVRPGTVLEVGETFQMAGPLAPTLPSRLSYTVQSPSGIERNFAGRANAVGYFYRAEDDFAIDEAGVWTVNVAIVHEGETSAGTVEEPFPTGGILSPNGTSYTFVAVDGDTGMLSVGSSLQATPPSAWLCHKVKEASFEVSLPERAKAATATVTVTMPGTVLVEQEVRVVDGRIRWDLDARALNELAESFDVDRGIGDMITVTFHANGELDGVPAQWVGRLVTFGTRALPQPVLP